MHADRGGYALASATCSDERLSLYCRALSLYSSFSLTRWIGAGGVGDLCLMPPSVTREVNFLVLSVLAAEGMPKMDDKQLGGLVKAGIDAFVEVKVST